MKEFDVNFVKIKNRPMVRDMKNKAILTIDKSGLQAYRDRKAAMEKIEVYGAEINTIKHEISELKDMLSRFIEENRTVIA